MKRGIRTRKGVPTKPTKGSAQVWFTGFRRSYPYNKLYGGIRGGLGPLDGGCSVEHVGVKLVEIKVGGGGL